MSTQGQGDVVGQLERPHAVSILSMSKEALGASLNSAWDEIERLRTLLSSSRGEQGLTFDEFSRANLARCEDPKGFNHPLHSWSLSDWHLATAGELGEAANVMKKLNRYRDGIRGNKESEDALRVKLRHEIGDTLVYLDLLSQAAGFQLFAAGIEVFNLKSEEIGYPVLLDAPSAPGSVPTSLAGQVQDGYVLVPRSVIASNDPDTPECIWPISWLRTMVACADEASDKGDDPMAHDEMVREVRRLLDGLTAALQSFPQPTARGDAPTTARGGFLDDEPECCPRCGNAWERPDPFALANGIDRAIKKAVSAERARVIEPLQKIIERSENGELGTSKVRDMADIARAALRALGQQDTGGADHG